MEGRMPGSEGAANSNGQSPDEELWNRPSHVHKNYKESKDQAEALTYFDRGEKKNFASLCLENLHAKKAATEMTMGLIFGSLAFVAIAIVIFLVVAKMLNC